MMKRISNCLYVLSILILLVTMAGCKVLNLAPPVGAKPKADRLMAIQSSPNFKYGQFRNLVPTKTGLDFLGYTKVISVKLAGKFFGDNDHQEPARKIPVMKIDLTQYAWGQDSATVISWLGHSASFIQIDGKRLLLDPMLSNVASPVSFAGPKRFSPPAITAEELPQIDAILISHDHYDHLDFDTIKKLGKKTRHFFVPLGIGVHLERWGVPAEKITELDWWQEATFMGLKIVATPSRHFSGRGLNNGMQTLWSSWVIIGRVNRIFFSGDTGYSKSFADIGRKYGPFDITLMECGQYNKLWPDIHMIPEQSVQAHLDLKGKLMMPIHWGAFDLTSYSWNDPIERVTKEARKLEVNITTPRIGESVILHKYEPEQVWWRE
ncbi:MBL fold metallo-hydrolase [Pontibacter sp. KCTC 32443]|uniref:MBL fold metallo-hydrolase n=1 Tax=Pontibacter TaxID=323449 RepID=UPI00164EAAE3|nr:MULTISPECIES: MBL fold metallo-hydrolase [Pontibacter]MBC5773643.1 MBL fold metallo-hydrolase [Pontibacter sp. KCTC 32443]